MNKKKDIVPNLRFPEFVSAEGWIPYTLDDISDRLTEKVCSKKLTTVSISAGVGFVSQEEKFSRDISGKQYNNYVVLKKGDFSYNKGNSKKFPQGCIYKLKKYDAAAVPNAFISFRFHKTYVADFYTGYFENNFHGKQLTKFITSGARMDGLLNINPNDFFSIILPTPKDKAEQQKIAACLSSIDELINAEEKKLDALILHRKGLLQKMFPAEGKTVPEIRFPEFTDAWEKCKLYDNADIIGGGTPSTRIAEYWDGDIDWYSPAEIGEQIYLRGSRKKITKAGLKNSSARILPTGTILFTSRAGIGNTAILTKSGATNQGFQSIVPHKDKTDSYFIFTRSEELKRYGEYIGAGSTFKEVSGKQMSKMPILMPDLIEQRKISALFETLDSIITSHKNKIELLKQHKKGLFQELFPTIEEINK